MRLPPCPHGYVTPTAPFTFACWSIHASRGRATWRWTRRCCSAWPMAAIRCCGCTASPRHACRWAGSRRPATWATTDCAGGDGVELVRRPTGGTCGAARRRGYLRRGPRSPSLAAVRQARRVPGIGSDSAAPAAGPRRAGQRSSRSVAGTTPRAITIRTATGPRPSTRSPPGRKKLVGSAQTTTRDAALQHGTIPLSSRLRPDCALPPSTPRAHCGEDGRHRHLGSAGDCFAPQLRRGAAAAGDAPPRPNCRCAGPSCPPPKRGWRESWKRPATPVPGGPGRDDARPATAASSGRGPARREPATARRYVLLLAARRLGTGPLPVRGAGARRGRERGRRDRTCHLLGRAFHTGGDAQPWRPP